MRIPKTRRPRDAFSCAFASLLPAALRVGEPWPTALEGKDENAVSNREMTSCGGPGGGKV